VDGISWEEKPPTPFKLEGCQTEVTSGREEANTMIAFRGDEGKLDHDVGGMENDDSDDSKRKKDRKK